MKTQKRKLTDWTGKTYTVTAMRWGGAWCVTRAQKNRIQRKLTDYNGFQVHYNINGLYILI